MPITSLYINLPVADLKRTRAFWSALGFSFNEQFSDDKGLCLVLNEGSIYCMFLKHEFFATFTHKPVADGSTTQVLIAIETSSRENVDAIVAKALAHGGIRYRDGADHGWMYYDCFADPDGHQWEVLFSDMSKLPTE